MSSQSSGISETSSGSCHLHNRDFKIIIDVKTGFPQVVVHLVAPTMQEKAAWISDISQVSQLSNLKQYFHKKEIATFSVSNYLCLVNRELIYSVVHIVFSYMFLPQK
jgi:hypothetical protein